MRTCLVCGCSDDAACPGGCIWQVQLADGGDICSACDDLAGRLGTLIMFTLQNFPREEAGNVPDHLGQVALLWLTRHRTGPGARIDRWRGSSETPVRKSLIITPGQTRETTSPAAAGAGRSESVGFPDGWEPCPVCRHEQGGALWAAGRPERWCETHSAARAAQERRQIFNDPPDAGDPVHLVGVDERPICAECGKPLTKGCVYFHSFAEPPPGPPAPPVLLDSDQSTSGGYTDAPQFPGKPAAELRPESQPRVCLPPGALEEVAEIFRHPTEVLSALEYFCGMLRALGVDLGNLGAPSAPRLLLEGDHELEPDGTPLPTTVEELCKYIIRFAGTIYVRHKPSSAEGWRSMSLLELPTEAALELGLSFVAQGRLPTRVIAPKEDQEA